MEHTPSIGKGAGAPNAGKPADSRGAATGPLAGMLLIPRRGSQSFMNGRDIALLVFGVATGWLLCMLIVVRPAWANLRLAMDKWRQSLERETWLLKENARLQGDEWKNNP